MITLKNLILPNSEAIKTFILQTNSSQESELFQSNIANHPRKFFYVAEGQDQGSYVKTARNHYHQFLATWNVQDMPNFDDVGDQIRFLNILRDVQFAYYCFSNNIRFYKSDNGLESLPNHHLDGIKPLRYSLYLEFIKQVRVWAMARGLSQSNVSLYLTPLLLKLGEIDRLLDAHQLSYDSSHLFTSMIEIADDFFKSGVWFSAFYDTLVVPLYAYALSKHPYQFSHLVLPILNPDNKLLGPAVLMETCETGYFTYLGKGENQPGIIFHSFCSDKSIKLLSLSPAISATERRTLFTPSNQKLVDAKVLDDVIKEKNTTILMAYMENHELFNHTNLSHYIHQILDVPIFLSEQVCHELAKHREFKQIIHLADANGLTPYRKLLKNGHYRNDNSFSLFLPLPGVLFCDFLKLSRDSEINDFCLSYMPTFIRCYKKQGIDILEKMQNWLNGENSLEFQAIIDANCQPEHLKELMIAGMPLPKNAKGIQSVVPTLPGRILDVLKVQTKNDIEARLLLPEWAESINDTFTSEQIVNAMIELILKNKINLLSTLLATKLHPEFTWDRLWQQLSLALETKPQRISEATIQCLAKYAGYEPPRHKRLVEFARIPGNQFLIDVFIAHGATLGKNKNLFSGDQSELNEKYLSTEFIKTNNFCICMDTVLEFELTNVLRAAFRLGFAAFKVEHLDPNSNRSGQLAADCCKVLKKVMANESSDKFQAVLRHMNDEIRSLGLKVPDIYLNQVSSSAACSSTDPSPKKIHGDLVALFNSRRTLNEQFLNLQKYIPTNMDANQLGLSAQRFSEIKALPLMTDLIYLEGLNHLRLTYPNMTEEHQCAVKESLNSIRMLVESINLYVDPLSSDIAKLIPSTKGPLLDPLQRIADGLMIAKSMIQIMTNRIDDQVKPEVNQVRLFSQGAPQGGSIQPPPLRI